MKILFVALLLLSAVAVAQSRPKHNVNADVTCPTGAACTTFNQLKAGHDETIKDADWACFYTESSTTRSKDSYVYSGPNPASITAVESTYSIPMQETPTTDEFFLLMDGRKGVTRRGVHPGIFVKDVTRGLPDEDWNGFGPEHGGIPEAITADWADDKKVMISTFDDLGPEFRFAKFNYITPKLECEGAALFKGKAAREACDCPEGDSCKKFTRLTNYDVVTIQKSTGRFVRTLANVTPPMNNIPMAFTDTFSGRCFRLHQ